MGTQTELTNTDDNNELEAQSEISNVDDNNDSEAQPELTDSDDNSDLEPADLDDKIVLKALSKYAYKKGIRTYKGTFRTGKKLAAIASVTTAKYGFKVSISTGAARGSVLAKCEYGGEPRFRPDRYNRTGKRINRASKLIGCTWRIQAKWDFKKHGFVPHKIVGFHNHDRDGKKLESEDEDEDEDDDDTSESTD